MEEDIFTSFLKTDLELEKNDVTSFNKTYNIFYSLGIENNEVLICRLLASLLEPNGTHQLGIIPLELFIKMVLGIEDETKESLNSVSIKLEETFETTNNKHRRIDLVIKTEDKLYPIEVKIWSGDQPSQLFDYYHYCFGEANDKTIYYLTPDGHEPSSISKKASNGDKELTNSQIRLLAFQKDSDFNNILSWINAVIEKSKNQNANTYAILNQFKEVVTNMLKDIKEEELQQIGKIINDLDTNKTDDIKIMKKLYYLCLNAKDIRKVIQNRYWKKRIDLSNDYLWIDDLSEMPEVYKSEVFALIKSRKIENLKFWLGIDNRSLYLLYQNEGKFPFERVTNASMDEFIIDPVKIDDQIDKIKKELNITI